jgi:hypothetical protein
MSNALAIAAVTETLVQMLSRNLVEVSRVPNAWVSSVTPDQTARLANPGVNIFLYQVTPNAAFRNADLPTRAADGTLLRKPQAALDLHYLLTFYGDETALEPQRLLGAVTLALYANPNLARNIIQPAPIAPISHGQGPGASADSFLENQSQLIRFTPVSLTLEEMSKLWSFLLKVDYVLSSAYVASVVLIETDDPSPPPALPVLAFKFGARPIQQPNITQVVAAPNAAAPITAGGNIALVGSNLAAAPGGATEVLISGVKQTPATIAPNRITLTLPAGLAAGAQTAQVMQPLALGTPPVPHPGTGSVSGIAAFVISPTIAPGSPPGDFAISVLPAFGSPPDPAVMLTVIPTARKGQHVLLLLTQSSPAFSRLYDGGTLSADSDTLTIAVPGLPPGTYFAQVLVDGAQSALVLGPGGVPTGPTVTL